MRFSTITIMAFVVASVTARPAMDRPAMSYPFATDDGVERQYPPIDKLPTDTSSNPDSGRRISKKASTMSFNSVERLRDRLGSLASASNSNLRKGSANTEPKTNVADYEMAGSLRAGRTQADKEEADRLQQVKISAMEPKPRRQEPPTSQSGGVHWRNIRKKLLPSFGKGKGKEPVTSGNPGAQEQSGGPSKRVRGPRVLHTQFTGQNDRPGQPATGLSDNFEGRR